MKATRIIAALLAVLALASMGACSCKPEETPSAPSVPSTQSVVSQAPPPVSSTPIDADFRSHKFELRLYKTSNWSTFKAVSPKTTVVFSLSYPMSWTKAEGDEEHYLDANGDKIMKIETPVQMSSGKTLPSLPAKEGSTPLSNEAIRIAGIDGRLLVWDEVTGDTTSYRYAYFMQDGDIVYRISFYTDTQSAEKRELFDAVIDKLTNGK